jgi:hypothetical protein
MTQRHKQPPTQGIFEKKLNFLKKAQQQGDNMVCHAVSLVFSMKNWLCQPLL